MRQGNACVSFLLLPLVAALGVTLVGCATAPLRHPLPPELADQARLPGMPADVRYWGDDASSVLRDWLDPTDERLAACCPAILGRPHNYLVVSSGGVDGAFGAGLLVGWTAAGTRPEFQIVTGVSTGATIATLAFLGPEYDDSLRQGIRPTRPRTSPNGVVSSRH